ncbi:RNA polymerase sigma factor, partial [Patulibacter minatonensis]|uniref:RNA polymerase sigma factor n=1 Tax=Patulibacter minatonensis TaxID=298163 RepID=UPI000564D36E
MSVTAPQRPASAGATRRHPFLTATTTPDASLVTLAAAGDERAFEILFQRHRTDVLAYATRMLRDHGRAEDVVQDVFVSAMRAIVGAAPEQQPKHVRAWLREIARRACIDQWRGSTRRGEVSLDAPERLRPADAHRLSDDDSLARTTDGREAVATLRLAFDDLPELQHAVLVQRELEGRSIAEIAARLEVTPTVVEGQLARGRRALGQAYRELESGQRCVAVRALCDASLGGRLGVRDRHRVGRHVQGCDTCRRYAHESGVDSRLVDRTVLSRASLLLPFPLLRRLSIEHSGAGEAAGGVLGAKVLVGAAVLAAGSGGAYVARVAPSPKPAPAPTDVPTPAEAAGLRIGPDGRAFVKIALPDGGTAKVTLPGASPVAALGGFSMLPAPAAAPAAGVRQPAPTRDPIAPKAQAPDDDAPATTLPVLPEIPKSQSPATATPNTTPPPRGSGTPTRDTAPVPVTPGAVNAPSADDVPSGAAPDRRSDTSAD